LVDRFLKYAILNSITEELKMPNWCNNNITIRAPKKKLEKIVKAAKKGELLNHFLPMPKQLDGTTAPTPEGKKQPKIGGFDNWYDWRVHNWGTKWDIDVYEGSISRVNDETVTFGFDSAWAPPIDAYNAVIDKHSDVSITAYYYEPGMDFAGEYADGEISEINVSDEKDSYFTDTALGKELDAYYGILESREEWEAQRNAEVHSA